MRRLDHTEGVSLIRYFEIGGVVAGDLKEHASVRAAFVGLPRRMQEPRSKAEAGGDSLAVADQDADILERISMAFVAFDIGEECAIIACPNSLEMRREIFHERGGLPERLAVLLVGKEGKAGLVQERCFRRQLPGPLVSGGKLACLVLAGLDVRLIERIDAED